MQTKVAEALLEIGAVGFSVDHPITFKSGIVSPVYVDNRRLPFHPEQWNVIIKGFEEMIRDHALQFDVLAGVAVGGVPHSSALGYALNKPSIFIRKEPKDHGKGQRVEGGDVEGRRVLLVEDLVTTGGSSLSGIEALRDSGAIIGDLIAIVSYGFDIAEKNFSESKIRLHTLTNFEVILDTASRLGVFTSEHETIIRSWFEAPYRWAERK